MTSAYRLCTHVNLILHTYLHSFASFGSLLLNGLDLHGAGDAGDDAAALWSGHGLVLYLHHL